MRLTISQLFTAEEKYQFHFRRWFVFAFACLIFVPFNLQHSFFLVTTTSAERLSAQWTWMSPHFTRQYCTYEYIFVSPRATVANMDCGIAFPARNETPQNTRHCIDSSTNTQSNWSRRRHAIATAIVPFSIEKWMEGKNGVAAIYFLSKEQFIFQLRVSKARPADCIMNAIFCFNSFNCIWILMWENRHVAALERKCGVDEWKV